MNLQQLNCAVEIARSRSISKASENLHINQSLLKNLIKELESEFSITIFTCSSRGILPTKKGEEFLLYAQEILNRVNQVENLYKKASESHHIRISAPISCYIAQAFVSFIQQLSYNVKNKVSYYGTINSQNTMNKIVSHECSIGIIRYLESYEDYFLHYIEKNDLLAMPLWRFKHQLLVSQDNPLSQKDEIQPTDLEGLIEISHGDPLTSDQTIIQMNVKAPEIVVNEKQSQFELLCQIPQAFMWADPTPHNILMRYPLVQRKCSFINHYCNDVLIYRKGYSLTADEQMFVQKVREEIAALESSAD